jgi:hypothetical protein
LHLNVVCQDACYLAQNRFYRRILYDRRLHFILSLRELPTDRTITHSYGRGPTSN